MIKRLTLENFQIHKLSVFDLVPGVNVIAGPSDNGKSAVVRGWEWLVNNRPQGFGFKNNRSAKGELTKVIVHIGDSLISREKSEKENYYRVNGVDYKALRTDVPDAVASALDIAPVNIQSQHSPYFLLLDSPGEVARQLNKLVGLDIIDKVLSKINKKASNFNAQAQAQAAQAQSLQEHIARFPDLVKLNSLASRAARMEQTHINNQMQISAISGLVSKVEVDTEKLSMLIPVEQVGIALTRIETTHSKLKECWSQVEGVTSIVGTVTSLRKRMEWGNNVLAITEDFDLKVELPHNLIKSNNKIISTVNDFIVKVGVASASLVKAENLISDYSKQLEKLIASNPICPTCGQRFTKND